MKSDPDIDHNLGEKEEERFSYLKNLIEVNKSPNAPNQSYDCPKPSLYKIAEKNLDKETKRKKIVSLLQKVLKKIENLKEENSLLKNELAEKNGFIEELIEEIKEKDKNLEKYELIIKTYNEQNILDKKNFFIAKGIQSGVDAIEEIEKFNNNKNANNNYFDESEGTNNTTWRFGRVNDH